MIELSGKVAFITGGASGIGLALARACVDEGMKVMLADIDEAGLNAAVRDLAGGVGSIRCDVTDSDSVQAAADATIRQFGKIHLLINNAGVLVTGVIGKIPLEEWRRAFEVNVMSVVHGIETFLPLIRAQGEGGHVLNTASVGGHVGFAGVGPYSASKFAVVGMTESLASEVKGEGIGVSMLCPGFTNTRIAEHAESSVVDAVKSGMSADIVARFTLEQIQQEALYIFTHPGTQDEVEERFPRISAAFEVTAASDIINSDPDSKRIAKKFDVEDVYR